MTTAKPLIVPVEASQVRVGDEIHGWGTVETVERRADSYRFTTEWGVTPATRSSEWLDVHPARGELVKGALYGIARQQSPGVVLHFAATIEAVYGDHVDVVNMHGEHFTVLDHEVIERHHVADFGIGRPVRVAGVEATIERIVCEGDTQHMLVRNRGGNRARYWVIRQAGEWSRMRRDSSGTWRVTRAVEIVESSW